MKTVRKHLQKKLKDAHFREVYELDQLKLHFVKPIIEYRIKHKLTQKQLADQIGIEQQHISKIERGDFSSMKTVMNILHHIGYTIKRVEFKPLSDEKRSPTICTR